MRDAEFQLLVAASGASFGAQPTVSSLADVRWDRFLALAGRHRVQALCWNGLKPLREQIPPAAAAQFQAQSREIVLANLRLAAECDRLHKAFHSAGVPLIFLKGLTLAALAYRDPLLKMSVDIDLLVEPDRLEDAARVLRSSGYAVVSPAAADNHRLARWHVARKESAWLHDEHGTQVDLHTRVSDNPAMLPGLSAVSSRQVVTIGSGLALPTLADDELFAYLCVHGASSAWFRLKWITDLAAVMKGKNAQEMTRLYDRSQQLGAGRSAAQALLLAERLFALELGRELTSRLAADRTNRWLARLAERQLLDPVEPTDQAFGTFPIHASQLALMPGWQFKLSEAARQLRASMGAVRA